MLANKLTQIGLKIVKCLPWSLVQRLGWLAGRLVEKLDKKQAKIADRNLAICFPEASIKQLGQIRQASFISAGQTLAESLWIWQNPVTKTLARVERVLGKEWLDQAVADGKGLIVAGPHLGNWEVVGLWLGEQYNCMSMYRPPRQQYLEAVMTKGREASGSKLVPADLSGLRLMLRHLKKGGVCGILPDQEPREGEGVFAPFFGKDAYTMVLLARLAIKSGCPAVLGYAIRAATGGFVIHFSPIEGLAAQPSTETAVAEMNRAVADAVKQNQEQYLWSYKRFRTRPEGEPRIY